ncbi:unnamed protein product, partial [Adineta steineri]
MTGSMYAGRQWPVVAVLSNGKILVAGGYDGTNYLSTTELYDPSAGTWMTTGSMNTVRSYHTGTLLANGKVLVAGGYNGSAYLT